MDLFKRPPAQMQAPASASTGLDPLTPLEAVTLIYSRHSEIYVGRDPLSYLYPPHAAVYDRKRSREEYRLPRGLCFTIFDGAVAQSVIVASGIKDGVIALKAVKALGAVAAG